MKKFIYSISVLLTTLFFTRSSYAIWPDFTPVIPFAPQLCVMCIPPAISVAVSYYDYVVELKEDLMKYTDMTTLKQMAVSYASKMGKTAFNKWRQNKNTKQRGISYARTIENSQIADLKDEASVKNAFIKLFMQYPSDKARTKDAYKNIGKQLKMDTTLEMYLTAVELEKKLYGTTKSGKENNDNKNMEDLGLLKQVDLIESCLVQGENCDVVGLKSCQEQAGDGGDKTKEDQACFWNSALQAEKLYDEIMRYNLFLTVMNAQYQAVMGIDSLAKIKDYEKDKSKDKKEDNKDKSSFLPEQYWQPSINTATSRIVAEAAFADLTPEEEKNAIAELSGYEENLLSTENVVNGMFEDADQPDGFTTTIGERGDDIESLKIIEEVREDLNNAQRIHNLKQTLPEYKKVYQDFADVQEKMEQAKANLQTSGECVMNMIRPYYDNPNEVWLGGNCSYYREGQLICHYEPEKTDPDSGEMLGDFDILCPGDVQTYCYVQELRSSNITGGVAKYLLTLYSAAKDEDAAGDTEAFINTDETTFEGGYVSSANVTTGGKGSEVSHEEDSLFLTPRNSDEKMDDDNVKKMTTQTSDNGSGEGISTLKDQEKGEEEKEQARKDGLIRWVLGSETAKELALDLDTGEHNWGSRIQKFPLWNDQKEFYNQYIDGKYANIEEYINSMSQTDILMELADTLNLIYPYKVIEGIPPISAETQRKEATNILKDLRDGLKDLKNKLFGSEIGENQNVTFDDIENKKIEEVIEAENNRFNAIRSDYESKRRTQLSRLKSLYAVMNEANTKISELNGTYNQNDEIEKRGDATTPEAGEGLAYGKSLYGNRKLSKESPQNEGFTATQENNAKDSAETKEKQLSTENKAKQYEEIVKQAEKKAKEIKEELEVMRRNYVKALSDAEAEEKNKFAEFTNDLRAARQIDIWISAMDEVLPLDLSNKLLQCVKNHALAKVAEAKTEINKMKDDLSLYYVSGAEKVQEIHKKMIDGMSNIPLTELVECAALGEIQDFDKNSEEDIKSVINVFQDICKNDFCIKPDENFFVGAIGLMRDFSAPKPPLEFSSAPLHEVFHFDMIDFNNVDKYYQDKEDIYSNKKMFTSVESFYDYLNASSSGFEYGDTTYDSTVPIIWKYILKRHAFVQKEMDLMPFLSTEEQVAETAGQCVQDPNIHSVRRSGIFPCLVDDKYIVDNHCVSTSHFSNGGLMKFGCDEEPFCIYEKTVGADKTYDYLPECRTIVLDGKKISDKETGKNYEIRQYRQLPVDINNGSELGMILSYVADESTELAALLGGNLHLPTIDKSKLPHRLTFNQALLDAFARINKTEDFEDDEQTTEFYDANRMLYDRNQFGDYLEQVEYESVVADTMEKVKKQIDEISGKLSEVFMAADYTMSDDFNLLNEKDYNQAAEIMDEQKGMYMDLAIQKLKNMPQGSGASQNIRDKSLKLLHKIAVLQADSEEIVSVNGTEDLDELKEKILNQKADKSVSEKYKEKEQAEMERQRKYDRKPYCASYSITTP